MLIVACENCRRGFPERASIRSAEEAHRIEAISTHGRFLGRVE